MPAYKDTKRGTWYIKYSTKDAVTGKRKQILKRGFETKRDALKWESKQRNDDAAASSVTFRELSEKYFTYRNSRQHTREHQTAMLEKYFPYLDHRADRISKAQIMEWYLDLNDKDIQPGTKNLILAVVRAIFKYGHDFYDLSNVAVGLKRFKENKKELSVWSPEEFQRFADSVENETYRLFFEFIYWTGCRKAEAQALQYTDFKDGTVHIWRQWTPRLQFSELKTDASERTLKLSDTLQGDLKPLLERCTEDSPFVFGGIKPVSIATIQWQWEHAIEKAGVKRIKVHDLRHSFASNMICSGANIVAVSRYLGHSNINMTLKVYTHLIENADTQMVGMIDDMMKNGIKMVSQPS